MTSHSTIEVKRVLYTVPARLVGERLRLHIYDDRIEGYIGSQPVITLPRVRILKHPQRARCINYRHVIDQLARKPQAFRYSQLRDDLLPNATYQRIWHYLDQHLEARAACKRIVGILALAAHGDYEHALGRYLIKRIESDVIPTLTELEQHFTRPRNDGTRMVAPPDSTNSGPKQHPLSHYDALLAATSVEIH